MTRAASVPALLLLVATGCPSDPHNPKVLWLDDAPGDELHVRLTSQEPPRI